jgi:thiamine-phosphate pyrophosphorylase
MDKSCELYLRFDADALPATPELAALVAEVAPAALLVMGAAGRTAGTELLAFMDASWRLNVPVLIENDAGLARALGAEGVHLRADGAAFAEARRTLGEEKSVGVSCTLSRHEAMSMAELGADYIAFGETGGPDSRDAEALAEMIAWWDELFEVPCVVWLQGDETEEAVRRLIDAGADYIVAGGGSGGRKADLAYLRMIAALASGGENPGRSV